MARRLYQYWENMGKRRAIPIGAAAAMALLSGCVRSRPQEPLAMNQGEAWELVLPTATVANVRSGTPLDELGEYARRDGALGVHVPRVPTALDSWGVEHPSLDDPRYIYLPRNENRFLFFMKPAERTRRSWY